MKYIIQLYIIECIQMMPTGKKRSKRKVAWNENKKKHTWCCNPMMKCDNVLMMMVTSQLLMILQEWNVLFVTTLSYLLQHIQNQNKALGFWVTRHEWECTATVHDIWYKMKFYQMKTNLKNALTGFRTQKPVV